MNRPHATNILVPGRGHDILPDNSLQLSASAVQRVYTAAEYYEEHADQFSGDLANGTGGYIVMSGGYASLATAGGMAPPPFSWRESTLMCSLAVDRGVPGQHIMNSPASTSTLENVLRVQEEGYFDQISPDNPLGIVTQETQWDRLQWFARKVFALPSEAVVLIPAPGEEDDTIMRDEQKLMRITRLLYGPARTPRGLRRAEAIAGFAATVAVSLGLQKSPAEQYANGNSAG